MFVLDFVTDIFMDFNFSASPDLDDHTTSAAVVGMISTDNPDIALAVDPICDSDFPSEVSYFSTDAVPGFGPGFCSDIGTGSTLLVSALPQLPAHGWSIGGYRHHPGVCPVRHDPPYGSIAPHVHTFGVACASACEAAA